jgi:hypothetical protein
VTTNPGTVGHVGLYNLSGTKLCAFDTVDMNSAGVQAGACSTTVGPGWFYWAAGQTGATATWTTVSITGTVSGILSQSTSALPFATAANSISGSALPASLGALSPIGAATTFPFPVISCY